MAPSGTVKNAFSGWYALRWRQIDHANFDHKPTFVPRRGLHCQNCYNGAINRLKFRTCRLFRDGWSSRGFIKTKCTEEWYHEIRIAKYLPHTVAEGKLDWGKVYAKLERIMFCLKNNGWLSIWRKISTWVCLDGPAQECDLVSRRWWWKFDHHHHDIRWQGYGKSNGERLGRYEPLGH